MLADPGIQSASQPEVPIIRSPAQARITVNAPQSLDAQYVRERPRLTSYAMTNGISIFILPRPFLSPRS
jgi:hypothetical protein